MCLCVQACAWTYVQTETHALVARIKWLVIRPEVLPQGNPWKSEVLPQTDTVVPTCAEQMSEHEASHSDGITTVDSGLDPHEPVQNIDVLRMHEGAISDPAELGDDPTDPPEDASAAARNTAPDAPPAPLAALAPPAAFRAVVRLLRGGSCERPGLARQAVLQW